MTMGATNNNNRKEEGLHNRAFCVSARAVLFGSRAACSARLPVTSSVTSILIPSLSHQTLAGRRRDAALNTRRRHRTSDPERRELIGRGRKNGVPVSPVRDYCLGIHNTTKTTTPM